MLKLALFRNFDCRLHNTFSRRNFLLQKLSVTTPNFSDIFASKHIFSFTVIWLSLPDSKLFSGNMQFIKAFKASVAFTTLLPYVNLFVKSQILIFCQWIFLWGPPFTPSITPSQPNFTKCHKFRTIHDHFTVVLADNILKTCFLLVFNVSTTKSKLITVIC